MATGGQAVSFDEIIQTERARRKNEELANEIFGRGKKNKEATDRNNRSSSRTPTPSLASRMGVQKRSSSSTSVNARPQPPSRPSSTSLASRTSRIQTALDSPTTTNQSNISKLRGIAIKGAAGPFIVVATNFAPGTTAADIESAIAEDSLNQDGHNCLIGCTVSSQSRDSPVTAELVYSERAMADKIIKSYNGQKADGRLLRLSLKQAYSRKPDIPTPEPLPNSTQDDDDIDMTSSDLAPTDRYNSSRESEAAARARSNEHRRADPDVQDGRYGFSSTSRPNDSESSPVHENGSRKDQPRERERTRSTSRDRERDRDRDRDRDHERDRDDRRYDDREGRRHDDRRESYRDDRDRRSYDSRPPYDPPRGGRSSHYGNGVGGPRGAFGGYGAPTGPGRGMYSDRGGPRGAFGAGGGGFGRGGYGGRGRW